MGVTVKKYIDVFGGVIGRDVNQTETDPVSLQVDREGPIEVAITVSAHHRDGWPKGFDGLQHARRTNIPEMPDLVHIVRQQFEVRRQLVVGIGEDENSER